MPSITNPSLATLITLVILSSLFSPSFSGESAILKYQCFLNYEAGPEKRIRVNFTTFNMVYFNKQMDDFKTWPSAIMRISTRNEQNEEIRITKVRLSTDNMNILHYRENDQDVDIRLANSMVLKFYSIYLYLYLTKDSYDQPDAVPFQDIANQDLYFKKEMPFFKFIDPSGQERVARCEITLPAELLNITPVDKEFNDPEMSKEISHNEISNININKPISQNNQFISNEINSPSKINSLERKSIHQDFRIRVLR